MGSISDFGIGFAAPILVLATSAARVDAVEPIGVRVDVSIQGLRSTKGSLLVCLTANPKQFPDCGKDPKAIKRAIAPSAARSFSIEGVRPGTYAIAVVHDENGNNKMDLAVFMPREGFAFSRNPTIGFGPPKFDAAKFEVTDAGASQSIKMKYMF